MKRKAEIRTQALQRRALITPDARQLADRQVFERAHKLDAFQLATNVHIYRSVRDEVDTWPFFEYAWGIGKTVYAPVSTPSGLHHVLVTRDTSWRPGLYGIPEPVTTDEPIAETVTSDITVVIVPVVAFDKSCNRIGYGKGYYDRFLASISTMSMGLAYDCQISEQVPAEAHDVALSCVATDQRWYIP